MRIAIIVPVSPQEDLNTLLSSAKWLKNLKFPGEKKILYVFDGSEGDERVKLLKNLRVDVLARNTNRGKRAGAINDGLKALKKFKPELIAIFDVDSRPEEDFLIKCSNLKTDVYIKSTRRYIYNDHSFISKAVSLEYRLINFLLRISAFKQFNGLIGVLNPRFLYKHPLNEDAITEDADFATRMHSLGLKAELAEGRLFEQSPVTVRDFFNQRKRWYYGGLQLWKYFKLVSESRKLSFKLSWISSLTLTFIPVVFLPLIILSLPALLVYRKNEGFKAYAAFIIHCLVLQAAAVSAVISYLRGERVKWVPPKRS